MSVDSVWIGVKKMTNQEAINDLKVILSEITECEESICYITDVDAEPLRLAIKALERQIPKKPISYDSVPHNRCPVCNNSIKVFEDAHEHHYCLYCGQCLDWSDENT